MLQQDALEAPEAVWCVSDSNTRKVLGGYVSKSSNAYQALNRLWDRWICTRSALKAPGAVPNMYLTTTHGRYLVDMYPRCLLHIKPWTEFDAGGYGPDTYVVIEFICVAGKNPLSRKNPDMLWVIFSLGQVLNRYHLLNLLPIYFPSQITY